MYSGTPWPKKQGAEWGALPPMPGAPVEVPGRVTVTYWEMATWDSDGGYWVSWDAPEEPKDVDKHQYVMLACSPWEPLGRGEWKRKCTLTYKPQKAH